MSRLLLIACLAAVAAAQDGNREDALALIDLPSKAKALREGGVPPEEVKEALRAARGRKLKAKETSDALKAGKEAVDRHGRIDNFGAFVRGRVESGLRGQDLAAAIHEEHRARGKGGKGKGVEKQAGPGADRGKDAKEGEPEKQGGKAKEQEEEQEEEVEEGGKGRGQGRGKGEGQGEGKGKGQGKGKSQ